MQLPPAPSHWNWSDVWAHLRHLGWTSRPEPGLRKVHLRPGHDDAPPAGSAQAGSVQAPAQFTHAAAAAGITVLVVALAAGASIRQHMPKEVRSCFFEGGT
jgi:hypothetical protein